MKKYLKNSKKMEDKGNWKKLVRMVTTGNINLEKFTNNELEGIVKYIDFLKMENPDKQILEDYRVMIFWELKERYQKLEGKEVIGKDVRIKIDRFEFPGDAEFGKIRKYRNGIYLYSNEFVDELVKRDDFIIICQEC